MATSRLFRLIGGATLFLTLAAGGGAIWHLYADETEAIELHLRTLSLLLSDQTERTFQIIDRVLSGIAEIEKARPDAPAPGDAQTHALLRGRVIESTPLKALALLDADGREIDNSLDDPSRPLFPAPFASLAGSQQLGVSGLAISEPLKLDGVGPMIALSRAVTGPDGQRRGTLVALVDLDYARDTYRSVDLFRRGGYIGLRRSDGRLLVWLPATAGPPAWIEPALLHRYVDRTRRGEYRIFSHSDGKANEGAYREVPGYPLIQLVRISDKDAFSHVRRESLVIGVAAFLIGSVLFIVFLRLAAQYEARERAEQTLLLRDRALASSTNGILITDARQPDHPIIYVNPAFERITGYSAAEVAGRNWSFLLNGDTDQPAIKVLRDAVAAGEAATVELRNYRKDGRLFLNEVRVAPVRDEQGEITHFVGVQSDVTERKRVEELARTTEQRLGRALASLHEGYMLIGFDWTYLYVNAAAARHGRRTMAELIGHSILELYPGVERSEIFAHYRRAMAERVPQRFEAPYTFADGTVAWFEFLVEPVAEGITVLSLDITARKHAEDLLRREQRMEALGTLASGIAHDLNNTLVPILALSKLASSTLPPQSRERDWIADIGAAALRAKDLVQRILAFSRSESAAREVIDLSAAVAGALQLLRSGIPPTIGLRTDIAGAPVPILGNETQIHQIVLNLCGNAADAIGNKIGEIAVALHLETLDTAEAAKYGLLPGRYAHLSVSDTGPGISDTVREHIFDPFFTTKEVGKGTGLGLAIVHGAVSASGGGIAVTSGPSGGTRFDLMFPLAAQPETADAGSAMPAPI